MRKEKIRIYGIPRVHNNFPHGIVEEVKATIKTNKSVHQCCDI